MGGLLSHNSMNYFIFIIKSAIEDFYRNKIRTLLTSLGILIGVMAVVLLIALGLGMRKYIEDQFKSLGTNLLRVIPGKILSGGSFRGMSAGSFNTIRFDEKDTIKLKRMREAKYIAPVFTRSVNVVFGSKKESGDLYASTAEIFNALNLKTTFGDVFTNRDVDKRTKVVVLGPKIAEKLFGSPELAIDRSIKVEGQSFKVRGVLEAKGGGFGGPDFDSFVYMPFKTAYIFNTNKNIFVYIVKIKDGVSLDIVKTEVIQQLSKRYKEDEFSVIKQSELIGAINSIFGMINVVLIGLAAISLIVGGIGIMNIMYVSVTERIKEIGIRRALGARKNDILLQFLSESVILSIFGGSLGLLFAYGIVLLLNTVFPAYIDLNSIILALGVSSLIGIVFGVFPAKKAADLSPIDAIRYE